SQVGQVAIGIVIVEAVTNNEHVGDFKADIVGPKGDLLLPFFQHEHSGADRPWAALVEQRNHFEQRVARVEDVIDDQHVAASDFGKHVEVDGERSALGTFIAASLNHANAQRHVELADQVSQENDAARHDGNDGERSARFAETNLGRQVVNRALDVVGGNDGFHRQLGGSGFRVQRREYEPEASARNWTGGCATVEENRGATYNPRFCSERTECN